jgi:Flp pilus assembly protein TadD
MDKSAEDLRLAVQLDAANVAAHASLGVTLLEQNLLTQAFEEFTQALKLDAANHTFVALR